MTRKRILFVLNSEWMRLRRTGLSELSRIPEAINELASTSCPSIPWESAWLIVPRYALHKYPSLAGRKCIKTIRMSIKPDAKYTEQGLRIRGGLPAERKQWESFAEKACSWITEKTKGSAGADILAVDWPMAPIFATNLPPRSRTCFTVDLVPSDPKALELWKEGLRNTQRIHVSTKYWLSTLKTELAGFKHKCKTAFFGTQIVKGFDLDEKRAEKEELQRVLKKRRFVLNMDELLLVVRNRWTADDQKNYRAIIKTLPKLIRNAAKNGWKPQFIIGPFGNRRTPAWTKLRRKLRNLARRHRKQIFFENPDSKELILPKWGGLLKAADAQLVPSRYEPCGINHAQGMMYGTPPVCSKAGAMGEPPVNASNSFQFVWDDRTTKRSTDRFYKALLSTCDIYYSNRHLWKRMQKNAQRASLHYDWSRLAPQYAKLFR